MVLSCLIVAAALVIAIWRAKRCAGDEILKDFASCVCVCVCKLHLQSCAFPDERLRESRPAHLAHGLESFCHGIKLTHTNTHVYTEHMHTRMLLLITVVLPQAPPLTHPTVKVTCLCFKHPRIRWHSDDYLKMKCTKPGEDTDPPASHPSGCEKSSSPLQITPNCPSDFKLGMQLFFAVKM